MVFCYVLHGKIKHLLNLLIRFKIFIKIKSPIWMLSVKHEWMKNMYIISFFKTTYWNFLYSIFFCVNFLKRRMSRTLCVTSYDSDNSHQKYHLQEIRYPPLPAVWFIFLSLIILWSHITHSSAPGFPWRERMKVSTNSRSWRKFEIQLYV